MFYIDRFKLIFASIEAILSTSSVDIWLWVGVPGGSLRFDIFTGWGGYGGTRACRTVPHYSHFLLVGANKSRPHIISYRLRFISFHQGSGSGRGWDLDFPSPLP